ncbi:MAG: transporter substrate-binding domain-containing protein [Gammaproteobacteria bacterium]|nr:transporter substrate-binding domain-containing protein [Gammaproteobacteria bacterium]
MSLSTIACAINKYMAAILIGYVVLVSSAQAGTKLTLNSGTAEPFITEDGGGFYGEVVKEIFSRLDIDAKVIRLPSSRSILNANQGIDAGVIARTKGFEKKYANLIRVPSAIVKFKFVAYSLDETIKVTDWDSFAPYSVGIIRGWRIYEKNIRNAKQITKVNNADQLFKLLLNGRSDLVLFEYYRGSWWNKHLNAKAYLIGSPIAEKEMFIYMHKKHAALVPEITRVIEQMKQDGTYEKIKDKTLMVDMKQ